jgi:hypothetical protein
MKLQGRRDIPLEDRLRLQSEVDPLTGCILLAKKPCSSKYAQVKVKGKLRMAHVVVWELAGRVVPAGMELDHTCSRPNCIALAHLELVTHSENMKRAFARGSKVFVPKKLNGDQVTEMRRAYAAGGITQAQLAVRFGVSRSHVNGIITRRRCHGWA